MTTSQSRRSFLKAGLVGSLVLIAAGGVYRTMHKTEPPGKFVLDDTVRAILSGIVPVVLKGSINPTNDEVTQVIDSVHSAIAGLPLTAQKEIQDLFSLLALGPSRRFLVGLPDEWPQAKPEDIAAFLQNWRTSRLALLQTAYHGLHDLIIGSWYSEPRSWAAIGYPGPIKELS